MKGADNSLPAVGNRLPADDEGRSGMTDRRSALPAGGTRTPDSPGAPDIPHLAEVIAADSLTFEAECRRLYSAPAFGSFVRVEGAERSVFGVVAHIATASIDPGRRTQALHLPPERLIERMPQIELVLRTCFTALVVGCQAGGAVRPFLPPFPPEIHRFVHAGTPAEVAALTREPDFLRVLAAAPQAPIEDLLAAAIQQAAAARGGGTAAESFLVDCGRSMATLFRREPDRLQSIMRRIQSARRITAAPWERPIELV